MSGEQFRDYMEAAVHPLCPSESEWVNYHRGTLSSADRQRLSEHAAACPSCAQTLEDVQAFLTVEELVPASQVAQDLEAVLRRAPGATVHVRAVRRFPVWQTIAASLALAIGGESVWLAKSQRQQTELMARLSGVDQERRALAVRLEAMRQPSANAEIVDLALNASGVRSGGPTGQPLATIVEGRAVTLLLAHRPGKEARIEITGPDGTAVLSQSGFDPASSQLRLMIPAGVLPAGRYTIWLMDGQKRTKLEPAITVTANP